ncbi:MAG TPA: Wzz/FepE/Etk N-terminal domain-containing protein [Terriglobales bacterium]|jgi:uncharacterized protein involved in exopolysaccharide biosynthesis|nr:Wzz/FepE/Etk N-terminal domain-containing protein [Terriglobales bacterium]
MSAGSKLSEMHSGSRPELQDVVVVAPVEAEQRGEKEIDMIDFLLLLARNKASILKLTAAATVVAVIVSFALPKTYTATTTILPPEQSQSSASLLLGQIGILNGLSSSDLGLKSPGDLFVAMLRSRSIEDSIIDKFDLRREYGVKHYQDARKKLESRTNINAGDEGLISVSVTDRDPKRAADLANAYVEDLHTMNSDLAVSEASQRRLFYEQKLDTEREQLSQAELALKQAQEKTGLLQPDAQAKAIIQSVADMRAQVAIKEVQVGAMRTYATKDNPDLRRAEQELAGLRAQLAKMQRNTGESGNGNVELPTRQLPQAELEYIRRARDLKYHEALYEFLSKQLEAARLDEAKDAIVVQVVDKAVTPEKKSGPRRMLIVSITAIAVFLLSCFWIILREAVRRKEQDPNSRARLHMLRHYLKCSVRNP